MSTTATTPPAGTPTPTAEPLALQGPSLSLWRETWKRFRKNRRGTAGLVVLGLLFFVGVFAPFLAGTKPIVCRYKGKLYFPAMGYYLEQPLRWKIPLTGREVQLLPAGENAIFVTGDRFRSTYPANLINKDPESWALWPLVYADPYRKIKVKEWTLPGKDGAPDTKVAGFEDVVESDNNMRPCRGHAFGTDEFGRSVLARMIHGTSIALLVGFVTVGISSTIGLIIGSLAGYLGGSVDMALSRFTEIVQSIPSLILILTLVAIIEKPTIWHLMAVLGCTGWVGVSRLVRGEFLKLTQLDYVTAARALGLSTPRIIVRHVLPNGLTPVLVSMSFGIAGAILTESSLSFLGFGVQPPTPSWGSILRAGFADYSQWWLIVFPGAAVFVAVFTYNVIGDALQQAIDPRLR